MARGTARDTDDRQEQIPLTREEPTRPRNGIVEPSTWIHWDHGPANAWAWVLTLGFSGACGIAILRSAMGRPDWVLGWRITAGFLMLAGLVFVGRAIATRLEGEPWWLFPSQLGIVMFLLWAVYRSGDAQLLVGLGRMPDTVLLIYAVVGLAVLADNPRTYSGLQWAVLVCFTLFTAIYFFHASALSLSSAGSRHPVWGATLLGLWLVVLPRHLPSDLFLWVLARLAAVVTLLGVLVYPLGPYDIYGVAFEFHGTSTVPVIDYDVAVIRSLFVNRNTFSIVMLAGFLAAIAEYYRGVRAERSFLQLLVPSFLMIITGVGFFLAHGHTLSAVALVPFVMYFAYLDFGRDSVPVTTVLGALYVTVGIAFFYYAWQWGYFDEVPSGRYLTWGASIDAIRDNFSPFGEGLISTREFIDPYSESSSSPHNSYLATWIRFGAVGGLAYIGMVVFAALRGLRHFRTVDVAIFALVVFFVVHLGFEDYTLFRWEIASAVAALSIGYVAFAVWDGESVT